MLEVQGVKFYRLEEVAEQLHKSVCTIRLWINDGKLKCTRVGGTPYVTEAALAEMLGLPSPVAGRFAEEGGAK